MSAISRMLGKLLNREESRSEDAEVDELKPMEGLDEMEPQEMVKENKEETLKSRRAVSPVIATVVLVAVTITIAVAVAYWMSGISSQYTQFEKVEIQSGIFTTPMPLNHWEITITLKNSGTKTATLTQVYVNEVLAELQTAKTYTQGIGISAFLDTYGPLQIESGDTNDVTVWIDNYTDDYITLSAGTTVNIKIHSAAGMDYIKLVQLP